MKIYLAVLALVFSVLAEDWTPKTDDQVKAIHIECRHKHALTPEQVIQVRKIQLSNNDSVRNYFRCVAEKIGVYSADHGYYADRLAKQFKKHRNEDEVKKSAEDCISRYYKPDQKGDRGDIGVRNCFLSSMTGEDIRIEALQHLEASLRRHKTLNY